MGNFVCVCVLCFFIGDNNWYRGVVLEVGEQEISVLYADYGNTEKIPFSRIVPIPMHLLQLPFQITRCTLAGKGNKKNGHFLPNTSSE